MIKITFPDGTKKDFKKGVTGKDVALSISEGLARQAVAIKYNEELLDLDIPLNEDGDIQIITFKDPEGKEVFWHSSAHLMAQAVLRVFPESKLTIGPAIDKGFYYDIDHPPFKEEDLVKIEAEMKKIVKENHPVVREEVSLKKAKEIFKDNKYKLEILKDKNAFSEVDKEKITVYRQGEFVDLCKGPHVPRTGMIKAFKLTKISGAYWRGDSKNKQLQRIYGISYPDKKQLKKYLHMIEEAEKRDHRKLMKELDLIMLHEYSPGSPFFLEKGTVIYNELINLVKEEYAKRNYNEVITPQIFNKKLWEMSGHWQHYQEDMFTLKVEGQDSGIKPMNCPSHCLIYKRSTKSYKDLPLRIADFGVLHRNELSGTLSGLTRVRKFSQDDAHIFCTLEQVEKEIIDVLNFIHYLWEDVFGIKLEYYLSTKPEKALGDVKIWDEAEEILHKALQKTETPYKLKEGDGAFYGPKIDIDLEDALGRKWQCPTIQLDFNLPERFDLTYEGRDGKKYRPVMIHRAVFGSLERFIGILIEHYAGKFPLWLSPVQVKILTIADRHNDAANHLLNVLKEQGVRAETNFKQDTMNKKIREAQLEKVNYIVVIGDKEADNGTVNVRTRDGDVLGELKISDFVDKLKKEIKDKKCH